MSFAVEVETSALAAGKGPFEVIAVQLEGTARRVQDVDHTSVAAGHGNVGAAISGFCSRWASELNRAASVSSILGQNLEAAAAMYESAEQATAGEMDVLARGMGAGGGMPMTPSP